MKGIFRVYNDDLNEVVESHISWERAVEVQLINYCFMCSIEKLVNGKWEYIQYPSLSIGNE